MTTANLNIVAHLRYDHEGVFVTLRPPGDPTGVPLDSFYASKGDDSWPELRERALARAQKVAAALSVERPESETVQL